MAEDLGFVARQGPSWVNRSPLSRYVSTFGQPQRAATLRIMLESYEPFRIFRQQLVATADANRAARHTKAALGLTAHPDEIKDTLVNLGTFAEALVTSGGGHYTPSEQPVLNALSEVAHACADVAAAEHRIRQLLGPDAAGSVSQADVIDPLANALIKAAEPDARGAVLRAGNAIDSFITGAAAGPAVSLVGATGINSKLQRFATGAILPPKVLSVGYYLGNVRNAADHGVDPAFGVAWTIRNATGLEFVFVACSFIAITVSRLAGHPPEI
jgi:hypothetical protein